MPCGLVGIGIVRMLRHLQSELGPVLANIDVIPNQTDDPALVQAAERVHDALHELLAEMAVVIYRARRDRMDEVSNDDHGPVAVRRKP